MKKGFESESMSSSEKASLRRDAEVLKILAKLLGSSEDLRLSLFRSLMAPDRTLSAGEATAVTQWFDVNVPAQGLL